MEEAVAIFFQIFFELAIQLLGSSGVSFATGNDKIDKGCLFIFLHASIGGMLGWMSTLIAPHLVIPYVWLRLMNLLLAPLASGAISYGIASFAKSRGNEWDPPTHFVHGAMFAFMFGAARFAFGTH